MAQLGNKANLQPLIDALGEHIAAATDARRGLLGAIKEKAELEGVNLRAIAAGQGEAFSQAQIDGAVDKFIQVIDVAAAKTTFATAEDIFKSTTPV